jgi:hypothetical protein
MKRWKQLLAYAGFALAALAVATDLSPVAWGAIALLGLALSLRVLENVRERRSRRSASGRDSLSD